MSNRRPLFSDKFRFGKPKTPGFGIASDFYLSVLSPRPTLPSIIEVVNPKGELGAVRGFGAPLTGASDRNSLSQPMERGAFAIASLDKKSVLRMLVIPKEEAGYDPERVLVSATASDLEPEIVSRMRATWIILQLSFEAHDPMVAASLDFLLDVSARIGTLVGGVIADPVAARFRLPNELRAADSVSPIDARNFVSIQCVESEVGCTVNTQGMRKFSMPELELRDVPNGLRLTASNMVLGICQTALTGGRLELGEQFGSRNAPLQLATGGFDRAKWEGIPVLELIPTKKDISECLLAWQAESD